MKVPPPDRPAKEMQREKAFVDLVFEIRDTIDTLEVLQTRAATDDHGSTSPRRSATDRPVAAPA